MKQVLVNIHMYYQTNIKNPHSSVSIYNHKQPHKELLQNLPVARVTFDNHHLNDELSNTTLPLYLWSLTLPRTSVYITETDLYVIQQPIFVQDMSVIDNPHNTSTILGMILASQRSTTIHLWIKGHQFKSLKKKTWTIRKSVNLHNSVHRD